MLFSPSSFPQVLPHLDIVFLLKSLKRVRAVFLRYSPSLTGFCLSWEAIPPGFVECLEPILLPQINAQGSRIPSPFFFFSPWKSCPKIELFTHLRVDRFSFPFIRFFHFPPGDLSALPRVFFFSRPGRDTEFPPFSRFLDRLFPPFRFRFSPF